MSDAVRMRDIGKKGITSWVYTITDRNRTRMAILFSVVSTLTDLTGGYQRYINGHFHDAPPFTRTWKSGCWIKRTTHKDIDINCVPE
jgi:hypothetical protein